MRHVFRAEDEITATELISRNVLFISRAAIVALIKKGEMRLNGQRVLSDCPLKKGDELSVFIPQKFLSPLEVPIVFADQNILIVDKPPHMDVENNLLMFLKQKYPSVQAVHRLDRNTTGLVVLALNQDAFNQLNAAFKARQIKKHYYALVEGNCTLGGPQEAYLLKDSQRAQVKIFFKPTRGAKKIITDIMPVEHSGNTTLLQVGLITGRTHQIRAHLAFLGYPIVGDCRYGQGAGKKNIRLRAFKMVFCGLNGGLSYLNGKEFVSVCKTDINFID